MPATTPEKPLPDLPPLPKDPADLDLSETVRALQSEPAQRDVLRDTIAPTPEPAPGETGARGDGQPSPARGQSAAPVSAPAAGAGDPKTLEGLVAALDLPEDQRTRTESVVGAVDGAGDPPAHEVTPKDDPHRAAPALHEAGPERAANTLAPGRDEIHADHPRPDPSATVPATEEDAMSALRAEVPPPADSSRTAPWRLVAARARALELRSVDEGRRREAMARTTPAPVDYDLGECVAAALRSVAPGPEIAVRVDCPTGLHMEGDPLALRWMVCELVDNAVNALAELAPEHPRALSVSCRLEADGNATIRCLDSGAGFGDSTIPSPHALGGLALVRTALAAEGGSLLLHSLRGRGTLAVLSVPDGAGAKEG